MKAEILYKGFVIGTITNGQTISLHCADKVLTGDVVVRTIADVNLISFTVDGTIYQAEDGMTWAEWCDSKYNPGHFYIKQHSVFVASGFYIAHNEGVPVIDTGIIASDHAYKIYTGEPQ